MYVCMCIPVYVFVCMYVHVFLCVGVSLCICVCLGVCVWDICHICFGTHRKQKSESDPTELELQGLRIHTPSMHAGIENLVLCKNSTHS